MAYDSLATTLIVKLTSTLTSTLDLGDARDRVMRDLSDTLAIGTGADQSNRQWHDQRTLAESGTDNLDLSGGLTDGFGASLLFARVACILIENTCPSVGHTLQVGGAASNPISTIFANTSDIITIGPSGILLLWNPSAAGYAITAGSADVLKIHNPSVGEVTYNITIIGSTA